MGPERNGKVPWTFRRRGLDLPPGNYRIVVSAVDNRGQRETRLRRYNNKRFVIR